MTVLETVFLGNYILSISLLSAVVAQLCKTVINLIIVGKFDFERLYGAGGMPSAHSALVCSMCVATFKSQGFTSPLFAIALVLAMIVMYDARGVRHETGEQAKVLNKMVDDWLEHIPNDRTAKEVKKLKEKVGHTPIEVVTGAILGIGIALVIPVF